MRLLISFLFFVSALHLFSARTSAQEANWSGADHVRARLQAGPDWAGQSHAVLEIRLDEGWHTYWLAPGDSGLAPRFDWAGSENVKSVDIHWPAPLRIDEAGLQVFGYKGDIAFPLTVQRADPAQPVRLALGLDVLICKDICIPQHFDLTLDPQDGPAMNIRSFGFLQERMPAREDTPQLRIESVVVGPDALVVNAYSGPGFDDSDVFAALGDMALTARPEITPREDDPRYAMIRIPAPGDSQNLMELVDGRQLHIVLTSGRAAVEKTLDY